MAKPTDSTPVIVRFEDLCPKHRLVESLLRQPLDIAAFHAALMVIRCRWQRLCSIKRHCELQPVDFLADDPDRIHRKIPPSGDANEPDEWKMKHKCLAYRHVVIVERVDTLVFVPGKTVGPHAVLIGRRLAFGREGRPYRQGSPQLRRLPNTALVIHEGNALALEFKRRKVIPGKRLAIVVRMLVEPGHGRLSKASLVRIHHKSRQPYPFRIPDTPPFAM